MRTQLFPNCYSTEYSASPVADWLKELSDWLAESGYCRATIRRHLSFVRYSLEQQAPLPRNSCFTGADLDRIFSSPVRTKHFRRSQRLFEQFLRSCGQWIEAPPASPHIEILDGYRTHLQEMRGLAATTVDQHIRLVQTFLDEALPVSGRLAELSAIDIECFMANTAKRMCRASLQNRAGYLRSFLRFCRNQGKVAAGIDIFDMPRRYRDARPPRAIPWNLIERLLSSIDRSTPVGLRDHAIFYLMAHYGLRTGEITTLQLESIDWPGQTLRVEQSKTRSIVVLPLTDSVADVLQHYLHAGRPASERPELFLRLISPIGPLTRNAIAAAFRRYIRRSGLPLAGSSPYGLRHGFAMRLLERNVGVKAIGDLLGHRTLESTCVYLRLQIDALRDVALPLQDTAESAGRLS